jgi:hypothetical protein
MANSIVSLNEQLVQQRNAAKKDTSEAKSP